MKSAIAGVAFAALNVVPLSAQAQFDKPEDAVDYRQSAFSVMSVHMGRIGAVVKGKRPYDKVAVEADAAIVEMIARLPWSAFPAGSDLLDSRAKPEIWEEQDKFQAGADKLQQETAKLSSAAKSGDLNAIKAAFGAVAKSCKSCHDSFRSR